MLVGMIGVGATVPIMAATAKACRCNVHDDESPGDAEAAEERSQLAAWLEETGHGYDDDR